jgi:hypothetical protein
LMVAKKAAKKAAKVKPPEEEPVEVDQVTVDRLRNEIEALEAQLDAALHPVRVDEPTN